MAWPVFFARHPPTHEEAMQPGDGDGQANFDQRQAKVLKRDALALLPYGKDVPRTLFHPARAHVAALWLRSKATRLAPLCLPADRCRRRDTKSRRRSTSAQPVIYRCNKPDTQIHRKSVSHPCWPPSPARILNQKSEPAGIPARFKAVEKRSKRAQGRYEDIDLASEMALLRGRPLMAAAKVIAAVCS